jgi:hypothetical protein
MPKDYAELWIDLFRPFLECSDWFMDPYSFVLNAEHIYYDKNNKAVSYIYIPSIRRFSGYNELKELAADISRIISVSDEGLENKVLRAIMKDFNPSDFLKMLKAHISSNTPAVASWSTPIPTFATESTSSPTPAHGTLPPVSTAKSQIAPAREPRYKSIGEHKTSEADAARSQVSATQSSEIIPYERAVTGPRDIIINIPENGKPVKKSKDNAKSKEITNQKKVKEKEDKKTKSTGGVFGRKKGDKQEIPAGQSPMSQLNYVPIQNAMQFYSPHATPMNTTQYSIPAQLHRAQLRLVGSVRLPQIINISITNGEVFTVGRFDAAIGRKQSSFEFDKKTKAISRRHAVIERHAGGYNIIDLSSSAGTFLNGDKLQPNTPRELYPGCRVSFGNAGADYVWESA